MKKNQLTLVGVVIAAAIIYFVAFAPRGINTCDQYDVACQARNDVTLCKFARQDAFNGQICQYDPLDGDVISCQNGPRLCPDIIIPQDICATYRMNDQCVDEWAYSGQPRSCSSQPHYGSQYRCPGSITQPDQACKEQKMAECDANYPIYLQQRQGQMPTPIPTPEPTTTIIPTEIPVGGSPMPTAQPTIVIELPALPSDIPIIRDIQNTPPSPLNIIIVIGAAGLLGYLLFVKK